MKDYGTYTGQQLNLDETMLIRQGDWGPLSIPKIEDMRVVKQARYLGWLLGKATPTDQYATALRKLAARTLPLSDIEKAKALITWAYPVFDVVAQQVYPPEGVRKEADDMARKVLGIQNWSMTEAIAMQPEEEGGIGMILPSTYVHCERYLRWMKDPELLTSEGRQELDEWREGRLGHRLSRVHVQLASRPVVYGVARGDKPWPAVATLAKAYGEPGTSMRSLSIPRRDILKVPL